MSSKTSIYTCITILDAYHLKNAIQRVSAISVVIDKTNNQYKLYVSSSNYTKTTVIVQNNLRTLPSLRSVTFSR